MQWTEVSHCLISCRVPILWTKYSVWGILLCLIQALWWRWCSSIAICSWLNSQDEQPGVKCFLIPISHFHSFFYCSHLMYCLLHVWGGCSEAWKDNFSIFGSVCVSFLIGCLKMWHLLSLQLYRLVLINALIHEMREGTLNFL